MPPPSHVAVFDFDGTLTPQKYKSLFNIIDPILTSADRHTMDSLREQYLPKLFSKTITAEEAKELITIPIGIYTGSGLTIAKIKKTLSVVTLKEQVAETLQFLHQNHIPVAIVSFGIKQFIEAVLEQQKIKQGISQVYAADLLVKNGFIYGYRPETIVIADNKGDCSRQFASQYGVPAKNILAVGDSWTDHNLGNFRYNRLGTALNEKEGKEIKPYFGEVVITDNFGPVLEWLKKKINKTV